MKLPPGIPSNIADNVPSLPLGFLEKFLSANVEGAGMVTNPLLPGLTGPLGHAQVGQKRWTLLFPSSNKEVQFPETHILYTAGFYTPL